MLQVGLRVDGLGAVVIPETGPAQVQGVQVGRRPPAEAAERALQGVLEGLSEVPVEVSVDERVQGGVEVADPEDRDDHHFRVLDAEHRLGHVPGQNTESSLRSCTLNIYYFYTQLK